MGNFDPAKALDWTNQLSVLIANGWGAAALLLVALIGVYWQLSKLQAALDQERRAANTIIKGLLEASRQETAAARQVLQAEGRRFEVGEDRVKQSMALHEDAAAFVHDTDPSGETP